MPPSSEPSRARAAPQPLARLAPRGLTIETALRTVLWLVLLAVVASTKTDPDLWGHVRFGMDMLRTMTIRQADTYSFTADQPWVNHEWAAEIVLGGAYAIAGTAGLIAVKLAVVMPVLALLNLMLRYEGVSTPRHRDLLAAAAVIATIEQAHNLRPQLFSLLFFAALLASLQLSQRNVRILAALPAIFALWVNFHGGWIVGGGVLLVWTAGVALSRPFDSRMTAWCVGAGAASLAATSINPEGLGLLTFLTDTVGFGRADITDWQPVTTMGVNIQMLWAAISVLAVWGVVRGRRSGVPVQRWLVVVFLAMGSFRVNRLLAFFALATLFLLGPTLARAIRRPAPAPAIPLRRGAALAAMTVALVLCAGTLRSLAMSAGCIAVDPRTTAEPGAAAFLGEHGVSGRLLVWFDWGQYALWHLAPHLRVSLDGRRETVYSAALRERHLRFYLDGPGGAALPDELRADYVWIPGHLPAAGRLRDTGWPVLYEGEGSVIFGRPGRAAEGGPEDWMTPEAAAPAPGSVSRCFPGP